MKTIVAATDFSAISLNAVSYAADLAAATGCNLSVIHVCAAPLSFSEMAVAVENIYEAVAVAEEQMAALKLKISAVAPDNIETHTIVLQGGVLEGIEAHCKLVNPYAVVMGTEGTTPIERFLVGGKTINALRQFSCPLIIVPPGVHFSSIRKIGLACDYKDMITTLPVKGIREIVNGFDADLHILHVSHEKSGGLRPRMIKESLWLRDMLSDVNAYYHFIEDENIEYGLHHYAKGLGLDLLIIVPKKHGLLSKLFVPAQSRKMVLKAQIPLVSVHE